MRRPPLPKHPKVRGELAEAHFLSRALALGFRVSRPFGDNAPYDFIVERGGGTARVQIKATACPNRKGWFHVSARGSVGLRRYTTADIDFIVALIFPRNLWYIIPVRALTATSISVHPRRRVGRYEKFREAWHLLPSPSTKSAA